MIGSRTLIRSVVVWRIRRRQFGHGIVFYIAGLHFIHILASHFHRSLFGDNRYTAFQVLVPDRSGEVQAAHPPVHEIKMNEPGVLEFSGLFMVEIIEFSADIPDVAEKPEHDINKMGELRKKGSAIQLFGSVPVSGFIIPVIAVPVAVDLHHEYISQYFFLYDLL